MCITQTCVVYDAMSTSNAFSASMRVHKAHSVYILISHISSLPTASLLQRFPIFPEFKFNPFATAFAAGWPGYEASFNDWRHSQLVCAYNVQKEVD